MVHINEKEEQTGFLHGYHDIPFDHELRQMSFTELVLKLLAAKKDSLKFIVLERELKERYADDQAKINRSNVKYGAYIAGVFTLIGVLLGAYLKDDQCTREITNPIDIQQVKSTNLNEKSPVIPGKKPSFPL